MLEALCGALARTASDAPVLLLLDDLHRSDPSTWELVDYLGRNPLSEPVAVVAAVRPHETASQPELGRVVSALVQDSLADLVRLAPLGADDVATLAERVLGVASVDAELAPWLYDRTRGNALYTVALLEQLREDLTRRVVPVSVKERVRMEAAGLSDRAGEALELAAALGHSFPLRQLALAMPEGAGTALDELTRRALLVERDGDATATYDFVHPLVQEAAYEAMGAGRRREVHARLARALLAEPLAVRAYHVARSALPGDGDAIALLREAAREAEQVQAHREALAHLQAALALIPAGTPEGTDERSGDRPERHSLLDEIAWQATEASDHTVALPALRELASLIADDPAELGRTRMRLASVLSTNMGDLEGAETEARGAIAAFERAAPERLAAGINELGWIQAFGGDFAAQEDACREAIAIAERDGDAVTLLHALGPLGHGLALRGRFDEARAVGGRALELARATGDANQIGWHGGVLAMTFALEGHLAEAATTVDSLLSGGSSPSDVAYFNRAWIDWFLGRWASALEDCEAVDALHPTAPSAHSAWVLSMGAALHAATGSTQRIRPLAGQAERVYGEGDFYWFSAAHRWGAAHLARIQDDADRAADLFLRAAGRLRRCGLSALESQILADVVESLVDASRLDEANAWTERARVLADELGTGFAAAVADHAAGVVDRDADVLLRAAAAWEELGSPFLRARALERTGDLEALTDAAALYAALPAPVLAERARADLRGRGPAGRRAAQRVGELTPREREVAALARRGLPTRAIAERLHLSERTIESHLARIYAKLGVSGRAELARADGPTRPASDP